jgi:hypothetical protein
VFEGSWEQIKAFIIYIGSSHQNAGNKRGRRTCNFICQRMTSVVAYISIGGVGLTQLRQASQTVSGIQGGHVPHGMVLVWIGHQRRDSVVFEGSWESIKVFIVCTGSSHQNAGVMTYDVSILIFSFSFMSSG